MSTPAQPAPSSFLAPGPAEATATVRPEQVAPGAAFLAPNWPDDDGEVQP